MNTQELAWLIKEGCKYWTISHWRTGISSNEQT
jgi:hypothetical protein